MRNILFITLMMFALPSKSLSSDKEDWVSWLIDGDNAGVIFSIPDHANNRTIRNRPHELPTPLIVIEVCSNEIVNEKKEGIGYLSLSFNYSEMWSKELKKYYKDSSTIVRSHSKVCKLMYARPGLSIYAALKEVGHTDQSKVKARGTVRIIPY